MKTSAAAALRVVTIGSTVLAFVAAAAPKLAAAALRGDDDRRLAVLGDALARAALALGPVAVKCAQMISYRRDLLPAALLAPLERLQDAARGDDEDVTQVLEAAWQSPPEGVLSSLKESPVAAGSIAVVLRGALQDQAVAVKVLRPGTEKRVRRDVACLRWLVSCAARFEACRGIPVLETFDHIAASMLAQCDLSLEAEHSERLRRNLAPYGVVVPRTRAELVRRSVLVQDYAPSLRKLSPGTVPVDVYRDCSIRLLRAVYSMIFRDGIIHMDLHPGNVFVTADDRLLLLDAGLVAVLPVSERMLFRDFFLGLALGDSAGCARAIVQSAARQPKTLDQAALIEAVEQLVGKYHGRLAGDFLIADFVYEVFGLQRRFGLYGTPGFVSAIWALVMFEGLVRHDFQELDFQAEARPFFTGRIVEQMRSAMGIGARASA